MNNITNNIINSENNELNNIISFLNKNNQEKHFQNFISECFLLACEVGDLSIVKNCIQQGADINFEDKNNLYKTSLDKAIKFKHIHIIKYLLEQGVNLYLSQSQRNPLDLAVHQGDKEIISLLLEHDKEKYYNLNLYRNKTIKIIASNNDLDTALFLKEHQFKLSIDNPEPFYELCSKGYLELIEFFISQHVEEYILGKALSYALSFEQYAVVDYFIQNRLAPHSYKFNVNKIKKTNEKMSDYFVSKLSSYRLSQKLEESLDISHQISSKIKI